MNPQSGVRNPEHDGSYSLAKDGFEVVTDFCPPEKCDLLANELSILHQRQKETAGNRLGGLRNLLQTVPEVNELAKSPYFKNVLKDRLGETAFPVRAIFFDKTPDANWSVAWHQDLSIAVAERIETLGFEGWSIKEGVIHVQPSREILENMVTVRLHLDDCRANNGPLKVIPGHTCPESLKHHKSLTGRDKTKLSCAKCPKAGHC